MTLTFELAAWFLFGTHHLAIIIICVKLYINPTVQDKVMGRDKVMGWTQTGFTEAYAQSLSADLILTFDLGTWFCRQHIILS